jgi:hypothetical protein
MNEPAAATHSALACPHWALCRGGPQSRRPPRAAAQSRPARWRRRNPPTQKNDKKTTLPFFRCSVRMHSIFRRFSKITCHNITHHKMYMYMPCTNVHEHTFYIFNNILQCTCTCIYSLTHSLTHSLTIHVPDHIPTHIKIKVSSQLTLHPGDTTLLFSYLEPGS